MFTAETQYALTLKLLDERIAQQMVNLLSASRKSTDATVQAAVKTMDNMVALKESIVETWKGQDDGSR